MGLPRVAECGVGFKRHAELRVAEKRGDVGEHYNRYRHREKHRVAETGFFWAHQRQEGERHERHLNVEHRGHDKLLEQYRYVAIGDHRYGYSVGGGTNEIAVGKVAARTVVVARHFLACAIAKQSHSQCESDDAITQICAKFQ